MCDSPLDRAMEAAVGGNFEASGRIELTILSHAGLRPGIGIILGLLMGTRNLAAVDNAQNSTMTGVSSSCYRPAVQNARPLTGNIVSTGGLRFAAPRVGAISLFVLGIAVLALRNPDPLLNPVIYTEDGVWTAIAFANGWLHTFIHVKDGYFVWGNLALLWIAATASDLICGNPLLCLPHGITLLSFAVIAAFAALAFAAT